MLLSTFASWGGRNAPRHWTIIITALRCKTNLSVPLTATLWHEEWKDSPLHYSDVIISAMASQIFGVSIVYSTVCSGADQSRYQSSASLAFLRGIHRWPVNSPHKGPVTRKIFPFDDVIMREIAPNVCVAHETRIWIIHEVADRVLACNALWFQQYERVLRPQKA